MTKRVLPIPATTLSALRRHVLANSFKTSASFPLCATLESFTLAQPRYSTSMPRGGAVHSIISCRDGTGERCPLYPGGFNRSAQHLLILRDEEVRHGDTTDFVHGSSEGRAVGAMEEWAECCGHLAGAGKEEQDRR